MPRLLKPPSVAPFLIGVLDRVCEELKRRDPSLLVWYRSLDLLANPQ
jgi:hypothetical protein